MALNGGHGGALAHPGQATGVLVKVCAIALSATLLAWPHAAAAQVKVLMSGGFSAAYEQLLPEFE